MAHRAHDAADILVYIACLLPVVDMKCMGEPVLEIAKHLEEPGAQLRKIAGETNDLQCQKINEAGERRDEKKYGEHGRGSAAKVPFVFEKAIERVQQYGNEQAENKGYKDICRLAEYGKYEHHRKQYNG